MGGIAGIMTLDGRMADERTLKGLSKAIEHRGPDGRGSYRAGDVGMVSARLAIIDPETGNQPLYAQTAGNSEIDGDGWVTLVSDGEIYNDTDLRAQIGEGDYTTRSDCESPLHVYLRDGIAFAVALQGMYAIAIHDPRHGSDEAGRLLLARDRFGIKPLYYAEILSGFAFASEASALVDCGLVEPELRVDRRDELLQLQFTTGHKTPFAGIDRVLPGETIVVEKGRIVTRQRIEALPQQAVREMTRKQGLEELERHLVDSVVAHLRSDVPCGIFLSGGIDSAAIGATMARLGKDPIIAFTAHTSSRKSMDELVAARAIAKTIGAKHIEVECGEPDFWSILPKIVSCMDEPAAESSALLYYRLAATAREADIKVVLTGEGGDELFGGYSRYRRGLRPRILGGRPMWSKGIFEGLGVLRNALDWRDGISAAQAEISANEKTALQAMQLLECAHRLPNDLLATLDRCLMAFGVEGRTPFIDRHFAQFAYCLPDGLKVGRRAGKLLLKAWVEASMPSVRPLIVRHSADVPVAEWIAGRANDLGALVASQPGIVECCKSGKVQRLFSSAKSNRQAAKASWALLFYALWHHLHILRRKPSGDVFETLSASE